MAIVKSEYNVLNPTSGQYDTHYLKTSVDQVSGLRGELDTMSGDITTLSSGKVSKSGDTISGQLVFADNSIVMKDNADVTQDRWSNSYLQLFNKSQRTGLVTSYFGVNGINSLVLGTENTSGLKTLNLYTDGTLTWGGNSVENVVASGTNYIRYASGLQICWGQVEYTSVVNVDNSFTVTFPIDFAGGGTPMFIVTVNGEWCTKICCGAISVNNTKAVVYALRSGGTNSIQNYCHWVAIGRWK